MENIEKNIDFEGEETIEVKENDFYNENSPQIYPAEIKVDKEVYSIYDLKRKYDERKTLVLDPDYQRESVWNYKQKSELVESILMGIPLPVMYFAQDKFGKLQVVDGKQRLITLFEFLNNKFSISSAPILKDLIKSKKFKELKLEYQSKIEDHQIIIYVIKPQTAERIKFDIFDRINRSGTQLNKQEMRNALYQGKSTELLKRLSKNQDFMAATGNSINTKRMKDKYLILRFLAFYLWKNKKISYKYKGNIDDFLGKTMEHINNLDDMNIKRIEEIFEITMKISYKILGNDGFRLPGDSDRKRPINMALFESLSYLMSNNKILKCDEKILKSIVEKLLLDNEYIEFLTNQVDSSVSVNGRFNKIDSVVGELF